MRKALHITLEIPPVTKLPSSVNPRPVTIEPYGSRFWAVYDAEGLICVCVYKRGAKEVQARLTKHP